MTRAAVPPTTAHHGAGDSAGYRRRLRASPLAMFMAALAVGCSDGGLDLVEPDVPTAGTLTVRWSTPNATDAAVRLTIRGPGIGNVVAAHGEYAVYVRPVESGRTIAVFGPLSAGDLVSFSVPDVANVAAYSVELHEVAGDTDQLRTIGGTYQVSIAR